MKHTSLLLSLFLFYSGSLFAQSWDELAYLGRKSHANGDLQEASKLLAQAADKKGTDNSELYLYAGILSALTGNTNETFSLLKKMADAGLWDIARLERNSKLAHLKTHQKWSDLVDRVHNRENEYVKSSGMTHPQLRVELKSMWVKEQDLIGDKNRRSVIEANSKRLHEIVREHGWPPLSMIGKDGAWFAWAIAQHSLNIDLQREWLIHMKALLGTAQLDPKHFAELHDRIAKNTGEDQKYGMAMISRDGKKVFYPIAEINQVDERRNEIGLSSLNVWANENGIDRLEVDLK